MKCEYEKNYECDKYSKKCVAYFKRENGEEGLDDGVMRVCDGYKAFGRFSKKLENRFGGSASGTLSGE